MNCLSATDENIVETFVSNDIDRNKYIDLFCNLLNSQEEATSIALDGRWGTGKTFFVKQTKKVLDSRNDLSDIDEAARTKISEAAKRFNSYKSLKPMFTIYFDAWEHDDSEEPVLSLLYCIAKEAGVVEELKRLKISIKKLFTGTVGLIDSRADNVKTISEAFTMNDIIQIEKEREDLKFIINEFLTKLPEERGERVNIVIDELDRCSPAYAVKLLERIKHYFNHDRITFVFAVNIQCLEKTIRAYYGNDIEGTRYLDRFFDIRMTIPPVGENDLRIKLGFNTGTISDKLCLNIIKKLDLSLRESYRYSRLIRQSRKVTNNSNCAFIWQTYLLPVVIAFKLTDMDKFQRFMSGNGADLLSYVYDHEDTCKSLLKYIDMLNNKSITYPDEKDGTKRWLEQYYRVLFNADLINIWADNSTGIEITSLDRKYVYESTGLFI